jgi:hypothetical protein
MNVVDGIYFKLCEAGFARFSGVFGLKIAYDKSNYRTLFSSSGPGFDG